jgi:hypothetical protein
MISIPHYARQAKALLMAKRGRPGAGDSVMTQNKEVGTAHNNFCILSESTIALRHNNIYLYNSLRLCALHIY